MIKNYLPDNVFIYDAGPMPLQIVTPLRVYNHLNNKSRVVNALWDTGASQSLVSERVVRELELKDASMMVSNTANGIASRYTSLCFALPGDVDYMAYVEAGVLPDAIGSSEFIVGLDIISMGDLSLRHGNGRMELSFTFDEDIFITRADGGDTVLHKMAVFKEMMMDRKKKSLGVRDYFHTCSRTEGNS